MTVKRSPPFVTFEYWRRESDGFTCARLRIAQRSIEIGNGHRLRADCIGWIKHLVATNENTPIQLLEREPK